MIQACRTNLLLRISLASSLAIVLLACPTVPPPPSPAPEPKAAPTATAQATPNATASPAPVVDPRRAELRAELRAAIDLGVAYLVKAVKPDGSFVYRINLDPQVTVKKSYNVLRHAGTMYALASYHQRWPKPSVAAALGRAKSFLYEHHIAPVPKSEGLQAVWETERHREAKLGGAGLALVALLSLEDAQPGNVAVGPLRQVGAFIKLMQKEDGSFNSKYFTDKGGPSDAWTSLYYPGEAALGLLMLHEHDHPSQWRDLAVAALGYLANMRRGRDRVEPDHWALLATARLFTMHDVREREWRHEPRVLRTHALQVCESMLKGRNAAAPGSPLHGSFGEDGRTTPTATRLEGMIASLGLVEGYDEASVELAKRMRVAIDDGVGFLLRAQVKDGPHAGAVPRAIARLDDEPPTSAFNRRASEVRIDYVQHALSAWMQYLVLLDSDQATTAR